MISVADGAEGFAAAGTTESQCRSKRFRSPDKAFLAFELPIKDGKESVQADEQGRLRINLRIRCCWTCIPNHLASLQVVNAGGQHGLVYRPLGTDAPRFAKQILLTSDVAILGDNGALNTFDTQDPSGTQLIDNNEPRASTPGARRRCCG